MRKAVVTGAGGLVAAQHVGAAEVGADDPRRRAATRSTPRSPTSLALWRARALDERSRRRRLHGDRRSRTARAEVIDFGMVAPARLDPAAYPLVEGRDDELFGWPAVLEQRNLLGPLSIAVPGPGGGPRRWPIAATPACPGRTCAPRRSRWRRRGLPVTWYTTLRIAAGAARSHRVRCRPRRSTLPDGVPPAPRVDGEPAHLPLGRLAETLERLAEAGPEDLVHRRAGAPAGARRRGGGRRARIRTTSAAIARVPASPSSPTHGGAIFATPGGLTAGPTFARALALIAERVPRGAPGPDAYAAWAEALLVAYRERLASMGDVDDRRDPACTTHLCVVDRAGTMVSLTQTLLSPFGSRVVSPSTGILLNNGVMWFDPRPGRPNSMAPGKRPLSNMCPVVATAGRRTMAGARRVGRAAYPARRAADQLDARGLRPRPGKCNAPAAHRRLRRRRGHRGSAPRARGARGAARPVPGPRGRAARDCRSCSRAPPPSCATRQRAGQAA